MARLHFLGLLPLSQIPPRQQAELFSILQPGLTQQLKVLRVCLYCKQFQILSHLQETEFPKSLGETKGQHSLFESIINYCLRFQSLQVWRVCWQVRIKADAHQLAHIAFFSFEQITRS